MPRLPIPVYTQQIAPNNVGGTPRVPDVGRMISPLGDAAPSIAAGLKDLAQGQMAEQQVEQKAREQDGEAWVSDVTAKAARDWTQHLQDRKAAVDPVKIGDFTPQVMSDFDKYDQDISAGAPTPRAMLSYRKHMDALKSELFKHAVAFEGVTRTDARKDAEDRATNQAASAVEMDPTLFPSMLKQRLEQLDSPNLGLEPKDRSAQRDGTIRKLSYAAAMGEVRRDPVATFEAVTGVSRRATQGQNNTDTIEPGVTGPRGIRNNNPGNLRKSASQWEGEVATDDPQYTAFATPEHGIRAAGSTLLTYQDRYGINTVQDIVSRWAPATENNTGSYIAVVSKAAGVKPDEVIDLHDRGTLTNVVRAMVKHENGRDPYSDAQMARGISAALGEEKLPTPAAGLRANPYLADEPPAKEPKSGPAWLATLDWKDRLAIATHAQSEATRLQADAKAGLHAHAVDAEAKAQDGMQDPTPISRDAFVTAFGQRDGLERFSAYASGQQFAVDMKAMQNMRPDERTALLENTKPKADSPNYKIEDQRWNIKQAADKKLRMEETGDPVDAAMRKGIGNVQPLDFQKPDAMKEELGKRLGLAATFAENYATVPRVLTNQESKAFASLVKDAPPETQKQYLGMLYQGLKGDIPAFKLTMQQIAPDAPVVALAGIYQGRGYRTGDVAESGGFFGLGATQGRPAGEVADLILRGHAILNPPKKSDGSDHMGGKSLLKMPEEKLMLSQWTAETGAAFKGKEQAADVYYQGALSIYAALAAERGQYDGVINSELWKGAIKLATGGIEKHNGSEIVVPYGWTQDAFRDGLKKRADEIVTAKSALGVTKADEITGAPLENVGDGRYIIRRGSGYLVGKDGRPVTLDFNDDTPRSSSAYTVPQPAAPSVKRGALQPTGVRRGGT